METKKMLPIGIEDFEKLHIEDFYYVDKTGMIRELLKKRSEVSLFTRPRRFGKSLNMSMLKAFFAYGCKPALFEGLEIAKDRELCERYMGKFPVISVTLKGVEFMNYETARAALCSGVGGEALNFQFLAESDRLSEQEREKYRSLINVGPAGFTMTDEMVTDGLRLLSELLYKHYGQKAILLIDEYDVPLDKAQHYGYYDQMLSLIRRFLGQALKSNNSLFCAVLTGCLHVSRESIFTGLNNLRVFGIEDVWFCKWFGFTDEEVKTMLQYYGLDDRYKEAKEWYDGYLFGDTDIYCPWDVINYIDLLRSQPDAEPRPFWINTSGNDIIRSLLSKATQTTKQELERLVGGSSIDRVINRELTYRELYSIDNLWSVLYATGYLTVSEIPRGDVFRLVIPNQEIRQI
ncbi:MAG: AAA family ATPase, partial [Lachnospiraceae bacterium]|nr:AAA family ATPase [Lachnospiraceae bacterium]